MHPARRALEIGLLLLAFSAPLAFGGVPASAVFALQAGCAALAILAVLTLRFDSDRFAAEADPGERRILGVGIAVAGWFLLQWMPLPAGWAALFHPGRVPTAPIPGLGVEPATWSAISYLPSATLDAAARWAAAVAALFAAAVAARRPAFPRILAATLVGSALFQSGYGLWEFLSGHQQIWGTPKVFHLREATGTFVNRNHFGAYLALLLPLAVERLTRPGERRTAAGNWRSVVRRTFEQRGWVRACAALAAVVVWLGIVFSYSRGAFLAGLIGLVVFLAFVGGRKRAAVAAIAVAILLPSAWLLFSAERAPGERLLQKFEAPGAGGNRIAVWKAAASMLTDHPLTGTGAGTFGAGFVHYQPAEVPKLWDHAHNELLQAAVEGGPVLIGLLLVALAGLVASARRLRGHGGSHRARIGIAAFAGLVALGGQSLVDFPFRLPGIAITSAILIGTICGTASALRGLEVSRMRASPRPRNVG